MTANSFYIVTSIFLVLLGYFKYKILDPFLTLIAWATVFSIVFYPVYVSIFKFLKVKAVASAVTLFIIVVIISGPFSYLSFIIVDDIRVFVDGFDKGTIDSLKNIFANSTVASFIEKF